MKYIIPIIIIFLLVSLENYPFAQETGKKEPPGYPKEELTVQLSQKCLFPGETVWFTIYCTSPLYPKTEVSGIAFIELVSDENAVVLRKKILLEYGNGKGEFILPEDLQTGIYHVLAYTNWMKNFGEETFFKTNVTIINPGKEFEYVETEGKPNKIPDLQNATEGYNSGEIKLVPDKQQYTTREKVTVNLETEKKASGGHFSIAVYRKEPSMHIDGKFEATTTKEPDSILYLPDYKGIRLTGNITNDTGKPVTGKLVTLSHPGPGTDINGTQTDAAGDFNFLLEPGKGDKDVVINLPGPNLKFKLEESFWNGFKNPPEKKLLQLNKQAVSFLKERYANFQLMEKFKQQNFKKEQLADTLTNNNRRFYSKPQQLINLSEYVTLDSLTEYFWELIPSVKFLRRKGEHYIEVIDPVTLLPFKEKPGAFVDGVLYSDYNEIAAIPVEDVSEIAVITETYYYKDFTFGGIVDIHTKKNDFNAVNVLPDMARVMYPLGSLSEVEYAAPGYSAGNQSRVPDLRNLICWKTDISMNDNGETAVEFYTSDVEGDFIIRVVGILNDGQILQNKNEIRVKAN